MTKQTKKQNKYKIIELTNEQLDLICKTKRDKVFDEVEKMIEQADKQIPTKECLTISYSQLMHFKQQLKKLRGKK